MNPIDINLLPTTDLLSRSQRQLRNNLMLVAASLGAVVILSWIVVFGLGRLAMSQLSTLEGQKQEQMNSFDAGIPKLNNLLTLKDKLGGIKKVQSVRPDLSAAIDVQQGLLVDGVATTRLDLNTSGQMNFDVTVRDVKSLSNYLTRLDSEETRSFFQALEISSLILGKDGGFIFSVNAQFDPTKLLAQK